MLSLSVETSLVSRETKLRDEAIKSSILTYELYAQLERVFEEENLSVSWFWDYMTDVDLPEDIEKRTISSTAKKVLSTEQFNALLIHSYKR